MVRCLGKLCLRDKYQPAMPTKPAFNRLLFTEDLDNLFSVTEAIRDKLPREIRDLIYDYVLDPENIKLLHTCAFPRLYTPPKRRRYWPPFVTRSVIEETVRIEIVAHFCKVNKNVELRTPRLRARTESLKLLPYLHLFLPDLFETGLSLSRCELPALIVPIPTSYGESRDMIQLRRDLAPVLQGTQKLANDFVLVLRMHTKCLVRYSWNSVHRYFYEFFEEDIQEMIAQLRKVYTTRDEIKGLVETQGTKRTTVVTIRFEFRGRRRFDLETRECMLDWEPKAWWDHVEPHLELRQ